MTVELAIRLRRADFNKAIVDGDLKAIATFLAPDVVLVAGTDSAVIVGRKAQIAAWKRELGAPDPTIYTRKPDTIIESSVQPIVLEHGHWQGLRASGAHVASGAYTAKWRNSGAGWVIEGELYLTLE